MIWLGIIFEVFFIQKKKYLKFLSLMFGVVSSKKEHGDRFRIPMQKRERKRQANSLATNLECKIKDKIFAINNQLPERNNMSILKL